MKKILFIALTLLCIAQPIKMIAQSEASLEETEKWLNDYSYTLLNDRWDDYKVIQYFFIKDGFISIEREHQEFVNNRWRRNKLMDFKMKFDQISEIDIIPADGFGGTRISFLGVLSFKSRSFDYYMGKTSVNTYEQKNQDFLMFMVAKDIASAKRIMKALTHWVKLKKLNVKIDNVLDVENKF